MITEQDINELEERVTRMFPYIDVTAVNVIRREVAHLRKLIANPVVAAPVVPVVETVVVEEKVAVTKQPRRKQESPTDKSVASATQDSAITDGN